MARDDRRDFLSAALLGATGGALTGLGEGTAAAAAEEPRAKARGLFPDGAPAAAPGYSPGIAARATASQVQHLNRTFSRYSSFAAHFMRLISIPLRQLVSLLRSPKANRRITLRLAGA